jgi:hypothetical protein
MERFILLYLGVTGVGALIVLAMPWLVVIGLIALVVPGLLLGLFPSAFLYGLVFASAWFATRVAFGEGLIAIAAGLIAVVAVALLTTQPARTRDLAAYRATIVPDVDQAEPIAIRGHVRFDLADARIRKVDGSGRRAGAGELRFACDSYCLSALFTSGVTQVTINRWSEGGGLAPDARSYRLAPRTACENEVPIDWPSIRPPLHDTGAPRSIGSFEDGKLLVSQWAMSLANEYCLEMHPAGERADFTIVERNWHNGAQRDDWSFGPGPITTRTLEIFEGQNVLYRAHVSELTTLDSVLLIAPEGDLTTFRFQLSRERINSRGRHGDIALARSLERFTTLAGRPQPGAAKNKSAMLPELRQQLADALADPAATARSPSFEVLETYLGAVGRPAEDADVALIARLVADLRLTRFPGAGALRLPLDQTRTIYDSYTARLIATGAPMEMRTSLMQNFVGHLGKDAIRLIGPLQEALVADPSFRLAVPELIRALGQGEAANGRRLFEMLRHHAGVVAVIHRQRQTREIGGYGRQAERDAQIGMIGAIKSGLCLLGPRDPALLVELDGFLVSGVMPGHLVAGHEMTDWQVILARMGKPIDAMVKPENMSGTEAGYRRNLREKVEKWRPDRC